MTEMVNGLDQSSSNFAPEPVTSSPAPSHAPTEERSFRQSEVNDLVGRAKAEAVERYKRESSMASHIPSSSQPSYIQQQPYVTQPQPQQQAMSEQSVRQMAAEETQRLRNEWIQESSRNAQEQDAQRIATEFFNKLESGKGKLQDFDQVMGDVDLRAIPHHVQLANMVDNTAEVMYELAKNPTKIGAIQNLIDIDLRAGRQPKLAIAEMKKLSQSIKDNAQAGNHKYPNEPLSQLRPSNAGADNKGPLSVNDYKRKYKV